MASDIPLCESWPTGAIIAVIPQLESSRNPLLPLVLLHFFTAVGLLLFVDCSLKILVASCRVSKPSADQQTDTCSQTVHITGSKAKGRCEPRQLTYAN